VLTLAEAVRFRDARRGGEKKPVVAPTHANLRYGPHERNVLDLWLAAGTDPKPLVICIHGGGFRGGDKSKFASDASLSKYLEHGVSVAAINYRLISPGKNAFPASMHDGARAIQFLRHHADKYRLDKRRFGATGGSAGGCMLMWLGFHDDMAIAGDPDPVRRESTRLSALAPVGGQTCLHEPTLLKWFGVKSLREHSSARDFFGAPGRGELVRTPELDKTMRDASPITYLTKDDPPIFLTYGKNGPVTEESAPGVWVHHPILGIKLKEAMDPLGMECHVSYSGNRPKQFSSAVEFLVTKLTGEKPTRK
jgi:acetyl esterase/lipase